ncbi:MAG: hypothetical protein ACYDIC_01115 [Desulfobaccales bacterium]
MFNTIAILPSFLGVVVIVSIVLCKYYSSPKILLLIIVIVSYLYQLDIKNKNNKDYNWDEKVINLSKFIITAGILGYIFVKIAGLFLPVFD